MKKTSKSTDHGGEEAERKKWMSCDFCRNPKKPQFSKKHIPVTDTEGGECQGATFYLKVYNTETVPLSEEKKAALEAEKAKERKKKKGLKAGLTPEEKQKQADEEYKTMLKAVEAEKKQNRKIALEKIRKVDQEFVDLLKPAWYQELSFKQMLYVETLGDALREDLLEGRLSRTPCILAGLGLNPLPNIKIVHTAAHKCFMNPLFFLLYLYKYYGKTPLLNTEKYYPPNDRLMLSAITYLALPRTLLELQVRLPVLPPKPFEYYPAVPKMRKKTYTSPYLEPQPYLKHYYEDAHRKDVILRRAYLYKLALLKQLVAEEKRIEMEVVGGRVVHMRYSRKPNGQDQIRTGDEVTPRISLAPDKSYPMPSWKRKKKSYCPEGKKKRRPRPIPSSACGVLGSPCVKICKATDVVESYISDITTEIMIDHNKVQTLSASENMTESETEINEKPVTLDDERGDNSNFESSFQGERKPVDDNDNGKDEESESTEQFMAKRRGSIENRSGQQHLSEDSSSKNILSTGDQQSNITGMLYQGADDFQSSVSVAIEEEDLDTSVIKTAYPQPLFLTLQAQFPRPYWCSKDYSLRPQFSTKVCGYVPPPEKNEAEAEALVVKVDSQAFLYRKCMQLPHPIPTIPTLKALLNGYWEQTIVFSRPQLLTQEDVTLLKTLGEEAFKILAKKHLEDMANEGNPIACFPGITDLPEIRKLIRTCAEFKLTKKLKDKLMQRSLALWDKAIGKTRRIKLEEMKMPNKKWTWDDIVPFKKMVHKHAFQYRQKVRRAVLDDTRDFWATTFMDHYENPGFRNVLFSYLPSREDDILFPIM